MEYRLKADGCLDFGDFTTLIKSLVQAVTPDAQFIPAFSHGMEPSDVKTPTITYKVLVRVPLEVKKRVREAILDGENSILVKAQKFKYTVEFCIWAENSIQADKTMNDFELMLETYTGELKQSGIQEILFLEQSEDTSGKWNFKLVNRTLVYDMTLERITPVKQSLLQMVTVRTNEGLIFNIVDHNEEE